MTRSIFAIAATTVVAALAVAGCGSSGDSSSGGAYGGTGSGSTSTSASSTPSSASGPAVVSVATVPKLGKIIVDAKGFTLYDFHKDKGTTSSCYGACAATWPPLTTGGAPKVGNGASAGQLGTTKRKDGTMQVTYAGHPLYTYTVDTKPGDAKGNDIDSFGAEWYVLTPQGVEP